MLLTILTGPILCFLIFQYYQFKMLNNIISPSYRYVLVLYIPICPDIEINMTLSQYLYLNNRGMIMSPVTLW